MSKDLRDPRDPRSEIPDPIVGQIQDRVGVDFPTPQFARFSSRRRAVEGGGNDAKLRRQHGLTAFSLFAWLLGSFVFCLAIRHFIRPTQWKV